LIITTGYRRPVLDYYLRRANYSADVRSFPAEIAEHPGTYSQRRFLSQPERIQREAQELAALVREKAKQGSRIWILGSGDNAVDQPLYQIVLGGLILDEAKSQKDRGLFVLKAK